MGVCCNSFNSFVLHNFQKVLGEIWLLLALGINLRLCHVDHKTLCDPAAASLVTSSATTDTSLPHTSFLFYFLTF